MKTLHTKTLALISLLVLTICIPAFSFNVEKQQNGILVTLDNHKVQIEVVDQGIIHVKKTPLEEPSYNTPELVRSLEAQDVKWSLKKSKTRASIKTNSISLSINNIGEIEYKDSKGKQLVSETNELTSINQNSSSVVTQAFTNSDEAIYGLGQYQSGIFDWKNVPVSLIQFNQEVVVPFIISTKNYGILWNNYSVTQFNPTEHEITFDQKAESSVSQTVGTNTESEDLANTKFKKSKKQSIRHTTFTPSKTGLYTFHIESDIKHKAKGKVLVTLDQDTVAHYNTMWMPKNFSGKAYLTAGHNYKVTFVNTGSSIEGKLKYNEPDYNKTVFQSGAGTCIDYYIIVGENPAQIISLNHKLTGNSPLLNKKSYGFWQCRERYNTQAELLENAREMRKRKIPFDMIVQDWFYWPKGTKGPEWDRTRYPEPEKMAKELKDMDLDVMVSVWPMINNRKIMANYDMSKNKLGKTHYFDFWDTKVGDKFYNILSDSMFKLGINSIWLDGTEPGDVPDETVMTAAGEYKYLANTFSLMVSKTMYEGRRKEYPNERVVNLTRSAFSSQQRYGAVTWSGDVGATWEQLHEQMSAGLNFTMSGIPYWTHDIGGFFRDSKSMNPIFKSQYTDPEYIELLSRWFQFGAFCPIFRIHGYKSKTEIWRYGTEFEALARKYIDLRYQLLPYIYSQAWQISKNGRQLMTPLVYHYPGDKKTWTIDDQLFFGESIMASFVTKYKQRTKEVYLPEGEWFDFWTNERIEGGRTVTIDTPLDKIPLHVKAGSIIPWGAKVQYATQVTDQALKIKIYPGKNAEYTLYLDDNSSYDYESGKYSEVKFAYSESDKILKIEQGDGSFIDFTKEPLSLEIEVIGENKNIKTSFKGKNINIDLK